MASAGKVLVCGGAGYIGSHMCRQLAHAGYEPIVFDNLSTGNRWAVQWGPLIEGDLLDPAALRELFATHRFDAVMHFAAKALVGESMQDPGLYFRNNVSGTLNLLAATREAGVERLVFSSTAAVYGNPERIPIDETHPTQPINPYGWSKLQAERAIQEYCRAHAMRAVALRYFNVAGASDSGEIGEAHEPETHLVPNIIRSARDSSLGPVVLFGDDFPTADGTCVRDYVHVEDLCDAHLLAMKYLDRHDGFNVFNLGTGTGHSVAQILAECQAAHGGRPQASYAGRRPGDPAALVASHAAALELLGWKPRRSLADIIVSASAWHRHNSSAASPAVAQD
jgi:UDP-glucose 4-epimerase